MLHKAGPLLRQIGRDFADLLGGESADSFTELEEKISLLRVLEDKVTTLTRGGVLARVIELRGKDYSGMDAETVRSLYAGRKMFFEAEPSNIVIFQQTHRVRTTREMTDEHFSLEMSERIAKRWAENFTESYRTRHFIIVATAMDRIMDKIGLLAEGGGHQELYRILDEYVRDTVIRLQAYSPRVLDGDDLSSYWAWLVNGRPVFQKADPAGWLDGLLARSDVSFPARKPYMLYQGEKERYAGMWYIATPHSSTDPRFLDGLFRLHCEFSIWQTFRRVEKAAALADIEDRRKNTLGFASDGDVILLELQELAQRIQADEIAMMRHQWVIETYGDTLREMEAGALNVKNVIENQGFGCKSERRNLEARFWSRFPEFDQKNPKPSPNPRIRSITSENAAHFTAFSSAGEGLDSCSWGPVPVMPFRTPMGSEYSFTFHASPAPKAPGHTLAIGGTGQGKTTTLSMILSQCFKYPNFKLLAFDRLHGLEVFTHFLDGEYLDILKGLEVNPLQLDDNNENRAFLANWLQVLTQKTTDEDRKMIEDAVRQVFVLERDERTLPNIADAFGLAGAGSIRSALDRWVSGTFSSFFTGKKDAMDFSKQLVTIDMTTLLDLPDVLAPLTLYLFYKLFLTARGKGGYAVFVDELPKYLANEIFAPRLDALIEEIRKTDGVFIGAAQSMDSVLNSKSATKFLNNIETYVLFPTPAARKEHYVEALRLNEQEFAWLTTSHRPREVMVKRKGGESVIVNTDLAPLGDYLKVFDSSSDAIQAVNELRKAHPDDWKELYLRG